MPTFAEIETSKDGGVPILLVIVTHLGKRYRYCIHETSITFDGEVYEKVALQVSDIKKTAILKSDDITVTLPRTVEVAQLIFPTVTQHPIRIEVRQTHEGASDAPLLFWGRVVTGGLTKDRNSVTLTAKDLFFQREKANSRRKFQPGCQLLLYGHKCRANVARSMVYTKGQVIAGALYIDVTDQGTAGTSFRGRNLAVTEQRQFLVGSSIVIGDKRYETERAPTPSATAAMPRRFRFHVSASDVSEISAFYASVPAGDNVAIIIPNCERTLTCCDEIHRNHLNFGGQPSIPYENPVGKINT
ncbi:hypothetical protein TW83_10000 [Paracoccus sp. S4493]|uniref:phage BR0599 family protein n=1 Tax=Paracoccus sp. S4493 TaxID=579490 RepID=UPI0005F9FDDF|nr:phage BR0599 family protein [Paracoccus sp. S4493]KJZ31245.1 hypothetical protein TW83_10000 [Paracoccus sp. S4493]